MAEVKTFTTGQVYASATDSLTGQVSLEEFRQLLNEQEKVDKLRQFGLTDEEIMLKQNHDKVTHDEVWHFWQCDNYNPK